MKTVRIGQLNINNKNQSERIEELVRAFDFCDLDFVTIQELTEPIEFFDHSERYGYKHGSFLRLDNGDNVGVLSRHALQEQTVLLSAHRSFTSIETRVHGRELNIISAHFPWGSDAEPKRCVQAEAIERLAQNYARQRPDSLTVLGGDLNAEPDYRSVRYLLGKEVSLDTRNSTLWTDAWSVCGSPSNEFTSKHSVNVQGRATAAAVGITDANYLPHRRIDYIMSRGWNYGRIGCAVKFDYIRSPKATELSDHEGIYADIMIH